MSHNDSPLIAVEFAHPEIESPVEVLESLFEDAGGNLTEMTAEDKAEYDDFAGTVTANEAIAEAKSIVANAPAFDHINYDLVRNQTPDVIFKNIPHSG